MLRIFRVVAETGEPPSALVGPDRTGEVDVAGDLAGDLAGDKEDEDGA